jgi:hypothetical protein
MSTQMVSRRFAGFVKGKRRQKKRNPFPDPVRREGNAEVLVRSSVFSGTPIRPQPKPWWQESWKPLATVAVILVTCVLAAFISPRVSDSAAEDSGSGGRRMAAARGSSDSGVRRGDPIPGPVLNSGARDGVVVDYDKRPPPTAESFMVANQVRRRGPITSLPDNVTGNCVISGGRFDEIAGCLERHGGR